MSQNPINVNASLYAARHGYKLVDEVEFDKPKLACAEGHVIKKGYIFAGEGKEIILGGTCQWKVFLFQRWEDITYEDITKDLEDIGRLFWIAERDGLWPEIISAAKAENVDLDLTHVPPREKQEWIKKTLARFIAGITARRKREAKEKERIAALERKRQGTPIVDKDYLMLRSAGPTGNPKLDSDKIDLVRKFETYRKWTDNQRAYALSIIKRAGAVAICPIEATLAKEISTIMNLLKAINTETQSKFVYEFTNSMMGLKLRNLSVKRRTILIQILSEYIKKKGYDIGFDPAQTIVSLNPQ